MSNNAPFGAAGTNSIRRCAVLLTKDDAGVAIITLTYTPRESIIACRDPRCSAPTVRSFTEPQYACSVFLRTVRSSERRGWRVFYDGPPLEG
jgi:hypothetical protein